MKDLQSLNKLIEALEELPSIGKKSAKRLAFHLAKDKFKALKLINAIENVVTNIKECKICGNFSDYEICNICSNENRDNILAIVISFAFSTIANILSLFSFEQILHIS